MTTVHVRPGDSANGRLPTPLERLKLGIGERVPVIEVNREGCVSGVYAGDRTQLIVDDPAR